MWYYNAPCVQHKSVSVVEQYTFFTEFLSILTRSVDINIRNAYLGKYILKMESKYMRYCYIFTADKAPDIDSLTDEDTQMKVPPTNQVQLDPQLRLSTTEWKRV